MIRKSTVPRYNDYFVLRIYAFLSVHKETDSEENRFRQLSQNPHPRLPDSQKHPSKRVDTSCSCGIR